MQRARGAAGRARARSRASWWRSPRCGRARTPTRPRPPAEPEDPDAELAAEEEAAARGAWRRSPWPRPPRPAAGSGHVRLRRRRPRGPLTVAAWAGDEVLVAEAETLAAFALARGERPVVAHDWKTIAMADEPCAAPPLEHDTMVAAYLIDPARRGYPLDELATEAGLAARDGRAARDGVAPSARCSRACSPSASARASRRTASPSLFDEIELPLVDVLVEMERAGRQARRRAACARSASASTSAPSSSSGASGSWPGRSSRSARRSSSRRSCSTSSACRASGAARPASRPTPACSRRSAHEHEIIPAIEEWREVTKLKSTYLDAFPELIGRRRPPAHHLQPDRHGHRAAVEHQPEPAEHPDPHRAGPRDPRLLRGRGGLPADLGRLLAGRAAAARPHRRRAGAQGHLPPRRGRAHRHGRGDPRRQDRSRHALEGEDGQLRDRLRAVGLRPGRPPADPAGGGAGVHRRATSSASPRSSSSSTTRSSAPARRAT